MDDSILDTIGSPLVQVYSPPGSTVAAKIESKNPGGSAKDRPALSMIETAESEGMLSPGDHIVEPTSGNTGIGLATVAAAKGYDLTIVMPESKSPERRRIMRAYGAEIDLVEGDISDAKARADRYEQEDGMVQLRQFENPANPEAHYNTTGDEIIEQVGDRTVDALVAGVGTGGTLSGIGRRLREEFPAMEIVAVEPKQNAVLSTGESGSDEFQGMGPGFVSDNLDIEHVDSVETVSLNAAETECRRLASEEGILVGQSSGASNIAARRVASRLADAELDCPPTPGSMSAETESQQAPLVRSSSAPRSDGGSEARPKGGPRNNERQSREQSETRPEGETRNSERRSREQSEARPASDGSDGSEYDDCPLVVTVFWDSGERYMSTGMFETDSAQ